MLLNEKYVMYVPPLNHCFVFFSKISNVSSSRSATKRQTSLQTSPTQLKHLPLFLDYLLSFSHETSWKNDLRKKLNAVRFF